MGDFIKNKLYADIEDLKDQNAILEQENKNLKTQVDAALKFSGWLRQVACKSGWQPSEARSDYDAIVGYMGMLEEENKNLNSKIEKLLEIGDRFMSASNWDCDATRKARADWYRLHPDHSERVKS